MVSVQRPTRYDPYAVPATPTRTHRFPAPTPDRPRSAPARSWLRRRVDARLTTAAALKPADPHHFVTNAIAATTGTILIVGSVAAFFSMHAS